MGVKISELTSMGTLAGTEKLAGVDSGTQYTTPADLKTYVETSNPRMSAFWVNFDGTGSSPITPRASYNVTSVTKNATGDFTITLTNALSSANFAVTASISANLSTDYGICNIATQVGTTEAAPTTTTIRIACIGRSSGVYDPKYVSLIGFV